MATTTKPAAETDPRSQAKADKEATDNEIAERLSSPPEPPTPTQAEADAVKSGLPVERDLKPGGSASGYTTR